MERSGIERKLTVILSADVAGYSRLMGEDEEAIATYKASIERNPDHIGPHIGLTVCYVECGREHEAQAQAAEILKVYPRFSVKRYATALTYKDPAQSERALGALRQAGLPE